MLKCDFNKLWHGCSPVNLMHICRTPFLKNIFEWLLLIISYTLSRSGTLLSNSSLRWFLMLMRVLLEGVEVYDIIFRTYNLLDFITYKKISVNFLFFKNCKILVFKIIPCEFVPRIHIFLIYLKRYRFQIYWKLIIFQGNHCVTAKLYWQLELYELTLLHYFLVSP